MVTSKELLHIRTFPKTARLLVISLIIVAGYAFFFNSKSIIPNGDGFEATPYNAVQVFSDQRTVSMSRWDYSPEQQLMEVEVEITNSSFDGVDTYDYTCMIDTGEVRKYPVKKIMESPEFSIVQIQNIPDNYRSVSLRVQPHGYESSSMAKIYGSTDTIKQVDSIPTRTIPQYQKLRINEQIQSYKAKIQGLEKEYDATQKKIKNIVAKNKQLDESKQFMTTDDIEKTNETINNNTSLMNDLKDNQAENIKQQKEYSLKIEKAELKAAMIK